MAFITAGTIFGAAATTFGAGVCLFTNTCSHISTAAEHFSKDLENFGEGTLALSRALNTTGYFLERHVTEGIESVEGIPIGKIVVLTAATLLILQTLDTTAKHLASISKSYKEIKNS